MAFPYPTQPAQPTQPAPPANEEENLRKNLNEVIEIAKATMLALEMTPNDGPMRTLPAVAKARMAELQQYRAVAAAVNALVKP